MFSQGFFAAEAAAAAAAASVLLLLLLMMVIMAMKRQNDNKDDKDNNSTSHKTKTVTTLKWMMTTAPITKFKQPEQQSYMQLNATSSSQHFTKHDWPLEFCILTHCFSFVLQLELVV